MGIACIHSQKKSLVAEAKTRHCCPHCDKDAAWCLVCHAIQTIDFAELFSEIKRALTRRVHRLHEILSFIEALVHSNSNSNSMLGPKWCFHRSYLHHNPRDSRPAATTAAVSAAAASAAAATAAEAPASQGPGHR